MHEEKSKLPRKLRAADLARRYRVDPRTIFRWRESGILPAPDFFIHHMAYWDEDRIVDNERTRLTTRHAPSAA
jgi:hypothetical protein